MVTSYLDELLYARLNQGGVWAVMFITDVPRLQDVDKEEVGTSAMNHLVALYLVTVIDTICLERKDVSVMVRDTD
jgi:hypothetical protein